jgi:hypothetical protein
MGKAKLEVVGVGKRTKCVRRRRIMVVMWSGPAVQPLFCLVWGNINSDVRYLGVPERNGLKFVLTSSL